MSKMSEQLRPFFLRSAMLLALGAAATGCTAFAGGGTPSDVGGGDGDDSTPGNGDPSEQVSEEDAALRRKCRESTEASKALLENRCASCHGGSGAAQGGFDTVMNINRLIDDGRVSPGRPDSSPLYALVKGGMMPPASVTDRPTPEDVQHLSDWIECGAPALARASDSSPFIGIDERLNTMRADLRENFDEQDRKDVRYLDLYTLANAGFSEEELDKYREALAFLLNSLSNGLRVASPQRVDDRGLLFRIELDDYGWSAQTWANIAADYPYAVVYNDDSQLFPVDEGVSEDLRELTGEPIPYLQADWFISHAVRPPLYYDILEIPDNLGDLAADLGVEIQGNIESGDVARVGFRNAASSQNDRVLERHELPGSRGALWVSYDFDNGVGTSNVLANPLSFQAAGMQITFNLNNGLQGFMITDEIGNRVDEADNNILQDGLSRNGAAEAGVSCLSCHQKSGITPRNDEVRAAVTASSANGDIKGDVFALYPEQSEMDELFAEDVARYEDARSRTILSDLADNAMHEINNRHLKTLDMAGVAAVLGMKVEDLKQAIERADNTNQEDEDGNNVLPADLLGLADGIAVRRDQFEASFPEFVVALGLGQPFRRNELVDGQVDADGSSDDDSSASDGSSDGTSDGSTGSDSSDRGDGYP